MKMDKMLSALGAPSHSPDNPLADPESALIEVLTVY